MMTRDEFEALLKRVYEGYPGTFEAFNQVLAEFDRLTQDVGAWQYISEYWHEEARRLEKQVDSWRTLWKQGAAHEEEQAERIGTLEQENERLTAYNKYQQEQIELLGKDECAQEVDRLQEEHNVIRNHERKKTEQLRQLLDAKAEALERIRQWMGRNCNDGLRLLEINNILDDLDSQGQAQQKPDVCPNCKGKGTIDVAMTTPPYASTIDCFACKPTAEERLREILVSYGYIASFERPRVITDILKWHEEFTPSYSEDPNLDVMRTVSISLKGGFDEVEADGRGDRTCRRWQL